MELKQLSMGKKGMIEAAKALIAVAILLGIGILVVATFLNNIDRSGFTADQNDSFDKVVKYTFLGFVLLGVGLLVLGGVAAMSYLKAL